MRARRYLAAMMPSALETLRVPAPRLDADFWSLRFVDETCAIVCRAQERARSRSAVLTDRGVMASVYAGGGYGYAATRRHVRRRDPATRCERAAQWARSDRTLRARRFADAAAAGAARRLRIAVAAVARCRRAREWYELLQRESQEAGCDPRIVDWEALVDVLHATQRLVTSEGGDVCSAIVSCFRRSASPRMPMA